jgi:thymidylate kinase
MADDNKASKNVFSIVLTGGPCGGKSSALEHFSKELTKLGFDIYTVPEVPSILMTNGCKYPGLDGGQKLIDFETHLINLQIAAEDAFLGIAKSTGRPSVVICDRGVLDVAAYLPEEKWLEVLKANNWSRQQFLARYDMVLHLVSAADGAESFYTLSNNAARTETPEQARALDKKMVHCWDGHSARHVVDNSTNFAQKLTRTTAHVLALVRPN